MNIMSQHDSVRLLQKARIVRLGCIANGEPYVVPINCHFDDTYLYSHSLPGLKIEALRKNARTCVQVDEIDNDLRWRSAIAFGSYEEITDQSARAEILNKLLYKFPMLTPVESEIAGDGIPSPVIVFRIRIDRITGVCEG